MTKIILDLCGGTGSWSKPYKEAGYDVRLITLPDHDVRMYLPPGNVYGILAAPPCTMFSIARQNAITPRDLRKGMGIVRACMNIIWECRYDPVYKKDGALKFWALENPFGILRQFLGKPTVTFEPYEYGDNWTKKTDIWGYFKEPKKKRIIGFEEVTPFIDKDLPDVEGLDRSGKRAITPPGFAKAFFKANK